jgi:DNA-binding MarR family transcriptional regulator
MKTSESTDQRNNQTVLSLLKATDRVQRHFTEILRSRGLTVQQYNALRILRGAGPKGLPTLEIGERLIEKTPGISRLVQRLVKQGLVRQARCGEDGRRMLCTLTPQALDLLAQLDDPITRGDAECLVGLTAEERQLLLDLTSRILPET